MHILSPICAGIPNIAKPLTRLTEGQTKFQWSEECQDSFRKLKGALINAPILSYPLPKGNSFWIRTPATWDLELSYLRSRRDRRRSLVISARRLANQSAITVSPGRAVSCCKGVEHFYKYVYGRRFLLRTDHAALKWLLQFKNPEVK
ncbi:hypothetical protein JTB14_018546 [Gonioctena quinquepunctata]|nr:hypothetical protein JTB14_018546 [Gonioctena quinquepunctata]